MSTHEDLRTPVAVSEEPTSLDPEIQDMLRNIEEGARDTLERIIDLVNRKSPVTSEQHGHLQEFVETAADDADTLEELGASTDNLRHVRSLIVQMRSQLKGVNVMSERHEILLIEKEERAAETRRMIEARSQRVARIRANCETAAEKTIPAQDTVVQAVHDLAPIFELVGVDWESKNKKPLKRYIKKAKKEAQAQEGTIIYLEDLSPSRIGFLWRDNQLVVPTGEATVIQKES